jgi:hypothetical protein
LCRTNAQTGFPSIVADGFQFTGLIGYGRESEGRVFHVPAIAAIELYRNPQSSGGTKVRFSVEAVSGSHR